MYSNAQEVGGGGIFQFLSTHSIHGIYHLLYVPIYTPYIPHKPFSKPHLDIPYINTLNPQFFLAQRLFCMVQAKIQLCRFYRHKKFCLLFGVFTIDFQYGIVYNNSVGKKVLPSSTKISKTTGNLVLPSSTKITSYLYIS